MYIIDFFPQFTLPNDFTEVLVKMNLTIANRQMISINEILAFINGQNYYGEIYKERHEQQIEANKYWINRFYPNDFKNKKEVEEQTLQTVEYNKSLVKQLASKIEVNK